MRFKSTDFDGLFVIQLSTIGDERGWFMRTFDLELFRQNIPNFNFELMQMNQSFNAQKHTWRGFHFQNFPFQETKIVRCIKGSVLDCVLDLRPSSNTFLKIYQIELCASNHTMLFIPKGFAHGFLTLEDNSELEYMHDEFYNAEYEGGIKYNDEKLDLKLPYEPKFISEKDKNHRDL